MANRVVSLVLVLGIGILISSPIKPGRCQQCSGDLQGLIKECSMYASKGGPVEDPSQDCCNIVKGVDVPCACQQITKEIEQILDMQKVVHIAEFCGKPLAHGMNCGSFTVP